MILVGKCGQLVLEFEMIFQPELLVVHRYALSDTQSFLKLSLQLQLQQLLRSELLRADVHLMHPWVTETILCGLSTGFPSGLNVTLIRRCLH